MDKGLRKRYKMFTPELRVMKIIWYLPKNSNGSGEVGGGGGAALLIL